jgi:hypothetical protein
MSQSRTAAANATAVGARTGRSKLKTVQVRQRTFDAPKLFLQMWNLAVGDVTVGTTAPAMVFEVPAGRVDLQMVQAKYILAGTLGGLDMAVGITYAVTTTHDGNTNPDAGDEPEVIVHYEPY